MVWHVGKPIQPPFCLTYENQTLLLLPEKALLWKEENILIIADLHLGKGSHFRKEGLNLSPGCHQNDLVRLKQLFELYKPGNVFFLGDLFHSSFNTEWLDFCDFISEFPGIQFTLVRGNHDILPDHCYSMANIEVKEDSVCLGPFELSHEPLESSGKRLNISGHIHPGIKLTGLAKQSLRLPCFFWTKTGLYYRPLEY
ncbi:MAG: ligase-associated DNA damage response endonuclease PdeM [Cytophagaceae bacterium]